jgi:DnaJ-class molecular chaperone
MPGSVPGGPAGDLYVSIRTGTDPRFSRVGADLWYDLHIQPPDAHSASSRRCPFLGGR